MADAGELKARATLDNAEFLKSLKTMTDQVGAQSQVMSDQIGSITNAFSAVSGAIAGLGAAGILGHFAQEALDAAAATDKLAAGFKAINGPSKETEDVFEAISALEIKSQFDFEDTLGPAVKHMMQLGVSAEQTAETMTAVVDAAAGMKEGPEWIKAVTDTIATMQSHLVASGKDMKALQAEGIDAWGALAREIGTSVPDAMAKVKAGMISSQTVTKAVTEEMADRFEGAGERSLNSWKGAMHVLSETSEDAMVAIGRTIREVLNEAKPIIDAASNAVKEFTEWFTALPGPVKEALVIVPAVLAAVVGVTAAFGAFQVALGALSFNPVVLGIAALVAALALIGQWTVENWPAIKAVFAEVVSFLGDLFAPLIEIWRAHWDAIKAVLAGVWDWIIGTLGGLKSTMSDFLGWIGGMFAQLPGAGELQKLGSIWEAEQKKMASAKEAIDAKKKSDEESATQAAKTRQAAEAANAAEVAAANAAKLAAAEQKKAADEAKKRADEQKKWAAEREAWDKKLTASQEKLAESQKKVDDSYAKAARNIQHQAEQTVDVIATQYQRWDAATPMGSFIRGQDALKALGVTSQAVLTRAVSDTQAYAQVVYDSFQKGTASATDYQLALDAVAAKEKALADYTSKDLTDAYHAFGLKTTAELNELAKNADAAYNKIVQDAGEDFIAAKQAWVTKTQESYTEILQQGGTLTEGQKSELDRAKQNLENHLTTTKSMWQTAYDGVKSAVTGAVDAMITKLVTGQGSFSEIMTGLWQDIASTALHTFIDPVKEAFAKFVANEIADLLGGKGLGGVLDGLKEVGKAVSSVFGETTSTAGDVAGKVPSAPSGGGGGGLGSIASGGIMGVVGVVAGVVTAISSVISNFQFAHMETSLNAIEHNTRYTMMYVGERADGGMLGVLFRILDEIAFGTSTKAIERLRDVFYDWTGVVTPILSDSKALLEDIGGILAHIDKATVANGVRGLTINISPQGLTTSEAARALGNEIARNLSTQLVPVS